MHWNTFLFFPFFLFFFWERIFFSTCLSSCKGLLCTLSWDFIYMNYIHLVLTTLKLVLLLALKTSCFSYFSNPKIAKLFFSSSWPLDVGALGALSCFPMVNVYHHLYKYITAPTSTWTPFSSSQLCSLFLHLDVNSLNRFNMLKCQVELFIDLKKAWSPPSLWNPVQSTITSCLLKCNISLGGFPRLTTPNRNTFQSIFHTASLLKS